MSEPLRYRPLVDAEGKFLPWVNDLKGKSGVYIIRNARFHECLYIGESHSGCLDTTLKRHFWSWADSFVRKHFSFHPKSHEAAVRICRANSAVSEQNRLINRLGPKYNTQGYLEDVPF